MWVSGKPAAEVAESLESLGPDVRQIHLLAQLVDDVHTGVDRSVMDLLDLMRLRGLHQHSARR